MYLGRTVNKKWHSPGPGLGTVLDCRNKTAVKACIQACHLRMLFNRSGALGQGAAIAHCWNDSAQVDMDGVAALMKVASIQSRVFSYT